MSFAGTVAWMAPEIIRNEPCNDKVSVLNTQAVTYYMENSKNGVKGIRTRGAQSNLANRRETQAKSVLLGALLSTNV